MTTIATRRPVPDWILPWAGLLTVLAAFELASRAELINSRFFPPISEMIARLVEEAGASGFWSAVGNTLQGWALGLGIACAIAIPLGIVIGSTPLLYRALRGVIEFLRPIPSVALIPLVIVLYGSTVKSTVVLVVYAAFWQVFIQAVHGVGDVDPIARDTARSYGLGAWQQVRYLLWPTALPYVVTGIRLATSVALILAITGELVIGSPGLGKEIDTAQQSGAVPVVYALILVTGLLGVLANVGTRIVERRALAWHPAARREEVAPG
jgi:ABC-type nitrate/sulfonate/bicarbonate transport system permease component